MKRRIVHQYDQQEIDQALTLVRFGEQNPLNPDFTLRAIARRLRIPKSTLSDWRYKEMDAESREVRLSLRAPPTLLSPEEEQIIAGSIPQPPYPHIC